MADDDGRSALGQLPKFLEHHSSAEGSRELVGLSRIRIWAELHEGTGQSDLLPFPMLSSTSRLELAAQYGIIAFFQGAYEAGGSGAFCSAGDIWSIKRLADVSEPDVISTLIL